MEQNLKRAPYTPGSPETWELIRSAYLRGASAGALSRHFGVTASAIYKRAWRHGWTKLAWASRRALEPFADVGLESSQAADRPGAERGGAEAPEPVRAEDEDVDADPTALVRDALAQAARALAARRPDEAQAYLRVADLARRLSPPAEPPSEAVETDAKNRGRELRAELTRRLDRLREQIERKNARAALQARLDEASQGAAAVRKEPGSARSRRDKPDGG
jgi:hypothetical protein